MAGCTVLMVDDDPFMRDLGRAQLEPAGFDVQACGDGDDALVLTGQRDFDLILVDVAMPQMSGVEFLTALRQQSGHARTPVLVLSAWCSAQVREEISEHGAAWLDKPARAASLIDQVTRMTGGAGAAG